MLMNGKCFNWIDTMRMNREFDSIRFNVFNQLCNDFINNVTTVFLCMNRMFPKEVNVLAVLYRQIKFMF